MDNVLLVHGDIILMVHGDINLSVPTCNFITYFHVNHIFVSNSWVGVTGEINEHKYHLKNDHPQ